MKILCKIIFGAALVVAPFSSCQNNEEDKEGVQKPSENVDESEYSLKVMTYNIHHANPPSEDEKIDLEAIIKVIKNEDPDLVALQEVDVNTERSGEGNQAQLIAEQLGMHAFFAKAIDYDGGEYGNAILSKFPLTEETVHQLPNSPNDNSESRVMASAIVQMENGDKVIFASTHLDYIKDSESRLLQVEKIVEIAEEMNFPMVIGGDFNDNVGSATIDLLDKSFTRTCRTCPPTIPVNNPQRAIDFIAFRHPEDKFKTLSHKVINETYASDHLPVVAEIKKIK